MDNFLRQATSYSLHMQAESAHKVIPGGDKAVRFPLCL